MTTDWLQKSRTVLKLQIRYGNDISHTCIIAQYHTGMYSNFTNSTLLYLLSMRLEVLSVFLDQQDKAYALPITYVLYSLEPSVGA